MSYPKVLSLLYGVCLTLSVMRTVNHCVRIEVETEIEVICGSAAGPLDFGLATRSSPSRWPSREGRKWTSMALFLFIESSLS